SRSTSSRRTRSSSPTPVPASIVSTCTARRRSSAPIHWGPRKRFRWATGWTSDCSRTVRSGIRRSTRTAFRSTCRNTSSRRHRSPEVFHVVVTGSECTGKSTLARHLAAHYSVEFVPEYVRDFAETVGGRLQFTDHGPIARGQMALEDEYDARASDLLIHDTD